MMKRLTTALIAICLAFNFSLFAQNDHTDRCASMDHLEWMKKQDPSLAAKIQKADAELNSFIEQHQEQLLNTKVTVTIPVVVHIVYNSTSQNISDSRVLEQLNVLNTDFAGLNTHSMYSFSSALKANTEIQFCLAQQKPDGTATSGIERRQTTTTSFSTNDNVKHYSTGGLDAWDPTKYLNIWVCNLSGGVLGYAQFPTSGVNSTFGVVIMYSAFGVTGAAAPYNLGGTASHEVGHCFNLFHIWGDDGTACSGTDNCSDTPNQAGANTGMPSFPHITCSNGTLGDMFMNFMDYTDDAGYSNFTPGQKARMQALIVSGGLLYSLTTSNACQAPTTGGCGTPGNLNTTSISSSGATLNWGTVTGASSYKIQYRVSGGTWNNTTSTSNSLVLTGLLASTTYEFTVQAVCSSGTGTISSSASFTTNAVTPPTCTDIYETNETQSTAKQIAVNTDISAMIGTATDVDWFKFNNTTSQKKIKITLTNLPADYDVKLYNSSGTLISTSQNSGTTSESIIYNTSTVGTYYIKVYGYSGAYSSTSCYKVRAAIASSNFRLEGDQTEEPNTPAEISLFPNPASTSLTVAYNSTSENNIVLMVSDITGRQLIKENFQAIKGINNYSLNLEKLTKGLYMVTVQNGQDKIVRKLIVD